MADANPNLISRIQSATRARLIGWQFAADGRWDIAERIFAEHTARHTASRIKHWLSLQTTANVAFEALFESATNECLLFGVRITHLAIRKKAEVFGTMIAMSDEGDGIDIAIQNLRSVLGDQQLACTSPNYLELGVLDLWNRVKSVVVWKKGGVRGEKSELLMPEELAHHVQKPDAGFAPLHECQTKPLILEAAWKRRPDGANAYQCWIGLPVSDGGATGGNYCLSTSRYLSAASIFMGRSPA